MASGSSWRHGHGLSSAAAAAVKHTITLQLLLLLLPRFQKWRRCCAWRHEERGRTRLQQHLPVFVFAAAHTSMVCFVLICEALHSCHATKSMRHNAWGFARASKKTSCRCFALRCCTHRFSKKAPAHAHTHKASVHIINIHPPKLA
jgi:hypothetical protein